MTVGAEVIQLVAMQQGIISRTKSRVTIRSVCCKQSDPSHAAVIVVVDSTKPRPLPPAKSAAEHGWPRLHAGSFLKISTFHGMLSQVWTRHKMRGLHSDTLL